MIRSALVGDLFKSEAQTLVNTVNCVGVMGKGIALGFKKRFPDMYDDYVARCQRGEVRLGQPYLYRGLFPPYILNFPTKDHWRSVSKLEDIVAGLKHLEQHYREWGITSLAVPPLGCGQGQLEWRVVGPTLYRYLHKLDVPVDLYAPSGTPSGELEASFLGQEVRIQDGLIEENEMPRINPAWVALVEIVDRIERQYYHWPIGHTRFQKLAYFATELGIPTGLHFERGSYGPFTPEIKPLLTRLVNNGLLREEKIGRMFILRPGQTYQDAVNAPLYRAALQQWEDKVDRIADLLLRVPTPDTEVAATVHYAWSSLARTTDTKVSEADLLEEVRRWKQRRNPPLDDDAIREAILNLSVLRWIDVDMASVEALDESEMLLDV